MAEMTVKGFLLFCFKWLLIFTGIFTNLDNIKSGILFVVGLVAGVFTVWSKYLDIKKNAGIWRMKRGNEKGNIIHT